MPCASTLARSSEPGDGTRRPPPASEAMLLGELTLPSSRTGWLTNASYRVPLLQQTPAWILLSASGGCPVSSSPANPFLCHHSPLFPRSLPSGGHPSSPRMTLSSRSPRSPVPSAGLSATFSSRVRLLWSRRPWQPLLRETGLPDGTALWPRHSCSSSPATPHPTFKVFPLPVTLPSLSTGLPVWQAHSLHSPRLCSRLAEVVNVLLCRDDAGCRPWGFQPWPHHSLALWPWGKDFFPCASVSPSVKWT